MNLRLTELVAQLEKDESNVVLQNQLSEALEKSMDIVTLRYLADEYFHSMAIGRPIMMRILELAPADDQVMAKLASLYAMHIEVEPAREWAHKTLQTNPRNLDAMYALSSTYFEPEKRLKYAEEMLAIDSHYYPGIMHKAESLAEIGQVEEAEQFVRDHIEWLQTATPESDQEEIRAAGSLLVNIRRLPLH